MGKFEERLLDDLVQRHGVEMNQATRPASRPPSARPLWIGAGALTVAGSIAVAVTVFGGNTPAFAVSKDADGVVTLSIKDIRAVDAANAEGAVLILCESLTSITEDVEVFAVSFEEGDEPAAGGHEHDGGGSLMVTGDSDSAREEFERCQSTSSLTCYRAANVVIYFDAPPQEEHVARVEAAIRALGDE